MIRWPSLLAWALLFCTLTNVFAAAEDEENVDRKPTPKFIRKLFRELFGKKDFLKEKREAAETDKAKVEQKSAKKQVVNAIHIGPHLGPPQGSVGNGYYGDAGFQEPVPAVLPTGHRSKIEKDKHSKKSTDKKQENKKRWTPYGLGFPLAPNGIGHGYGFSAMPYGYGAGFPNRPMWVRCEVPKGKDKSAKRCYGYGFGGGYGGGFGGGYGGGFGGGYGGGFGGLGYPGFGGYFPGFMDRPVYSSLPWQKSAKKSASKRWFDGSFGYGGLGIGMGVGYPGYGYGYPGGFGLGYGFGYPFGFYKSQVPKCKKNDKRCLHGLEYPYGLYPAFGCSSALCGAGYGGFGMSGNMWGMGGSLYPGGHHNGFYRSDLPASKNTEGERKHVIGYNPGIYTGVTGVFYPAKYPSSFSYGFPQHGELGSFGGYGGYAGYGGQGGFGLVPSEYYRSEVPHKKEESKEETGDGRDEIDDPFEFQERRQLIGSSHGGSLHGDGQGLGIGYPGAANLIQPGIAGVGDYGLGGGYSGIPLGLGNTGFGGYGMNTGGFGGFGGGGLGPGLSPAFGGGGLGPGLSSAFGGGGLGPGLSSAFGGDLAEGGFGHPHRSFVPEFANGDDENDQGQEVQNQDQSPDLEQGQGENDAEENGAQSSEENGAQSSEGNGAQSSEENGAQSSEEYHSKRQAVPYPGQHMLGVPPVGYAPEVPATLQNLPLAHEPLAPQLAQPFVHPFAPYAYAPSRNIHVGSPHVKIDVQTARSNIEEPKYDERSTDNANLRLKKRQISPIFTPVAAEPLAVPPVRYPVPPADSYPFGAGVAWPSASVPSSSGHSPPFIWSRSTLPGMLMRRGIMGGMGGMMGGGPMLMRRGMMGGGPMLMRRGILGGMEGMGGGMGGGPMPGGMEMGLGGGLGGGGLGGGGLGGGGLGGGIGGGPIAGPVEGGLGGGMGGGMGGGLGALLGGGGGLGGGLGGGGLGGGLGGGMGGGMGGDAAGGGGGMGAMMAAMQSMQGGPSATSSAGGLGGAGGGEATMDQSPLAAFSSGGSNSALSAALPGASSMPGMSGVQKKSGVPAKEKKNKSKKKAKN